MDTDTDLSLASLREKLDTLRRLDPDCRIFGASGHRYRLNPVLSEAEVAAFEARHGIVLPPGYRRFLLEVGDGGAGPWYGLEPLENALLADLDFRDREGRLAPSLPFPHTEAWFPEFDGDPGDAAAVEAFDAEVFDPKWLHGFLNLANYGCGIRVGLVVNGPEAGHVWVDDRANEAGIRPDDLFDQSGPTTFLQWFHLWLDASLREAGGAQA